MKRGRPEGSPVRKNVTELLAQFGELHPYAVYRHYVKVFPKVSMRAVYYCLSKGVKKGFFRVSRVEQQKGSYSWGSESRRVYYSLGQAAKPLGDPKVKKYFESVKKGGLLDLKPTNWGKGTERLSEEIDKVLY